MSLWCSVVGAGHDEDNGIPPAMSTSGDCASLLGAGVESAQKCSPMGMRGMSCSIILPYSAFFTTGKALFCTNASLCLCPLARKHK